MTAGWASSHRRRLCAVIVMNLVCVAAGSSPTTKAESADWLTWTGEGEGFTLPAKIDSAFVGSHQGAIIVAGGIARDEAKWLDEIYVLHPVTNSEKAWDLTGPFRLPQPVAYGASASTPQGVVCIGGINDDGCRREVYLLQWDRMAKEVGVQTLDPLPSPLARATATFWGNTVYVAGGQQFANQATASSHFWSLAMAPGPDGSPPQWNVLSAWPGPGRVSPVLVGQSNGESDALYLFGGHAAEKKTAEHFADAYNYTPATGQWRRLSDIDLIGNENLSLTSAAGLRMGAHHILAFVADGQTAGPTIVSYHTITDTWVRSGTLGETLKTPLVAVDINGKKMVLGLSRQSDDPLIVVGRVLLASQPNFGWVNYSVLVIYFIAMIGMGVLFSKRMLSTHDFFKAGGRIPWWAAGISIFGTQLSAITFMAIPAKTYMTNWLYIPTVLGPILFAPFVIYCILPFYSRLNVTTAYEYLEFRFNVWVRLVCSVSFILLQLGRLSIVLLLPSIALSVVTGIDIYVCIILMGIVATLYTTLGGIEAVIWTDVVQVVVLLSAAILSFVLIAHNTEGGFSELLARAAAEEKLHMADWRFDLARATVFVLFLQILGNFGGPYVNDQTVIQRYLTTRDEKAAARSVWTGVAVTLPCSFLFFGLGTLLFLFYAEQPARLNPALESPEMIFPWFIIYELPVGVSGLVIAGVFAAAMSSLDSSLNSIATAIVTDMYRRFKMKATEKSCLQLAKAITVFFGIVATAVSLFMVTADIKSLWDQMFALVGLITGGLGGVFLLGIFTKKVNSAGALTGMAISTVVQYVVWKHTQLHFFLYPLTGMVACIITGYVASHVFNAKKESIDGLTIYTLKPAQPKR